MTPVRDLRRVVCLRAFGAIRMLEGVQGAIEDVEGAIEEGQFGTAAYQARATILMCLSIRSLGAGGEIDFDAESASFDPCSDLPDDDVARAFAIADAMIGAEGPAAACALADLRDYVAETEKLLGYHAPLPTLRTPEGPFGLLALTKRWSPVLEELGLPPLLRSEWAASAKL
jgi:hypothetical protein